MGHILVAVAWPLKAVVCHDRSWSCITMAEAVPFGTSPARSGFIVALISGDTQKPGLLSSAWLLCVSRTA